MAGYENQLAQIVAELNRAAPGARDSWQDYAENLGSPDAVPALDAVLARRAP